MIWVLDTPTSGKLRILRISPFTGAVASAGVFAWDEANQVRQGFGVGADGSVLVYTSTGTSTRLATLAISSKKAVAITYNQLEGAHDGSPMTGQGETSLLVIDDQERTTKIDRLSTLQAVSNQALSGLFQ